MFSSKYIGSMELPVLFQGCGLQEDDSDNDYLFLDGLTVKANVDPVSDRICGTITPGFYLWKLAVLHIRERTASDATYGVSS